MDGQQNLLSRRRARCSMRRRRARHSEGGSRRRTPQRAARIRHNIMFALMKRSGPLLPRFQTGVVLVLTSRRRRRRATCCCLPAPGHHRGCRTCARSFAAHYQSSRTDTISACESACHSSRPRSTDLHTPLIIGEGGRYGEDWTILAFQPHSLDPRARCARCSPDEWHRAAVRRKCSTRSSNKTSMRRGLKLFSLYSA